MNGLNVIERMYSVIVVGCGATGSNLVALLSQYAISEKKLDEIILIDFDMIEAKNFINQKFTEKDINKNKARVLSNRYSKLDINISYVDKKIENKEQLITIIESCKIMNKVILVGCVDNNIARKHMHYTFIDEKIKNLIYIDTGNGDIQRVGQTVVGVKYNNEILSPPVADIYHEILDAETKEEEINYKCSNIEEHPQNFVVNVMSATVVFTMINNIISLNKAVKPYTVFNTDTITIK